VANPMNRTRRIHRRRHSPGLEALDPRQILSGSVIAGLTGAFSGRFPSAIESPPSTARLASAPSGQAGAPSLRQHPLLLRTIPSSLLLGAAIAPKNSSLIAREIIDLTNQARAEASAPTLSPSSALMLAAQLHSQDMARLNLMSHDIPGIPLASLTDRAAYVHYHYLRLGENIAYNQADAASVVTSWMNSQPHRENMLDPSYTQIGIGVARNQRGEPYYSMMLGTPA